LFPALTAAGSTTGIGIGIQTKGYIARCAGDEAVQCNSKRLLAEGLSAFQLLKLAEQLIALAQKFVPLAKSNIALS
jgi:hypothetical protein